MSKIYEQMKGEPTKKRSLGRGLSALMAGPESEAGVPEGQGARRVRVGLISENPFQPRTHFKEEAISTLAESIKLHGIIQPLLVRKAGQGRFELVCGERRLRAAKRAGISEVPVTIRDINDTQALELALIENLQREDLDPIEEANGYKALVDRFSLALKDIGEAVGRDPATVSNMLRLLELEPEVRDWLSQGKLTAGHARALLALEDGQDQKKWAQRIMEEGLSVRVLEEQIYGPKRLARQSKKRPRAKRISSPDIRRIVDKLEHVLGTKVEIRTTRQGGRIEICYHSLDDFQRIITQLGVDA